VISDSLPITVYRVQATTHLRRNICWKRSTGFWQAEEASGIAHLLHLSPPPFKEVLRQRQGRFDLPLDIEIIVDVCLAETQIGWRRQHLAECARVLQHDGATRWFPCR